MLVKRRDSNMQAMVGELRNFLRSVWFLSIRLLH